jgi:pilus assembly protein Flp/PilA
MFKRFISDESGATAIEYGLMGAILFLGIIGAMTAFGDKAIIMFNLIATKIGAVIP